MNDEISSSVPSWVEETIHNPPPVSSERHKRSLRQIKNMQKRLKVIHQTEGLDYKMTDNINELKDRFFVASNMRKKQIANVLRDIEASSNVELCFLVDVTGSMQSHINAVRDQIIDIVNRLTEHRENQKSIVSKIRLGFVGYRDLEDKNQFEVLEFTENPTTFKNFCQSIVADGGGDTPEDVFGGLEQMLKLPWTQPQESTKIVFHIADAPCHGKEFHSSDDSYPDGDPNKRTHTDLFKQIREKNIQYYFGKITAITDTMVRKFSEAYGEPIVEFDIKTVDQLADSVVTSVKISIDTSIGKSKATGGSRIHERRFTFVQEIPDWSEVQELKACYMTYGPPGSIDDIINDVPLIRNPPQKTTIQMAENPFAQGSERVAFYGRDLTYENDDPEPNLIVLKEYKHDGKGINSMIRYEMSNETQTIAAFLANEFTKIVEAGEGKIGEGMNMEFLKLKTVYISDSDGNHRNLTLEEYFPSNCQFIRFSNNGKYQLVSSEAEKNGISMDFVELLMAFSHWTYQISNEYLMVVDLQGIIIHDHINKYSLVLLTDPAIHCKDPTRFGFTNLGESGMDNFLKNHKCNKFCQAVKIDQ